jgi:hypothetical protein
LKAPMPRKASASAAERSAATWWPPRHRFVQAILRGFARTMPGQRRAALLKNVQVLDYIRDYSISHNSGFFVHQITSPPI